MSATNQYKCLKAQIKVMLKIAKQTNGLYSEHIAFNIWKSATGLAVLSKWSDLKDALKEASLIYPQQPPGLSREFSWLVKTTNAEAAFWLREQVIRILKPNLRR